MPKKIKPSQISMQVDWEIGAATEFAADLLEDVNDHNMAALRCVNVDQYDIACEFIELERDQNEAGSLTTELRARRDALLHKLREAVGE